MLQKWLRQRLKRYTKRSNILLFIKKSSPSLIKLKHVHSNIHTNFPSVVPAAALLASSAASTMAASSAVRSMGSMALPRATTPAVTRISLRPGASAVGPTVHWVIPAVRMILACPPPPAACAELCGHPTFTTVWPRSNGGDKEQARHGTTSTIGRWLHRLDRLSPGEVFFDSCRAVGGEEGIRSVL